MTCGHAARFIKAQFTLRHLPQHLNMIDGPVGPPAQAFLRGLKIALQFHDPRRLTLMRVNTEEGDRRCENQGGNCVGLVQSRPSAGVI